MDQGWSRVQVIPILAMVVSRAGISAVNRMQKHSVPAGLKGILPRN